MGPLGLRVGSPDEGLIQVGERAVACTQEYFEIENKFPDQTLVGQLVQK